MPAAIEGLVVVKWLTMGGGALQPGAPALKSIILASDPLSGELLAAMDGNWLTGVRTAAVTAIAAQRLALPQARSVAFIGAGLQARTHALALCDVLPIRTATVMSGSVASAQAFAEWLGRSGVEASVENDARAAVAQADIVITSIPFTGGITPFVDASWLKPGVFASAVDLGRAWISGSYGAFDRIVTDDLVHTQAFLQSGVVDSPGSFDADLPGLLTQSAPLAADPAKRTLLFAPGVALADAAMAKLVLGRLGTRG
jgi:ornithine cyclodeaminase/alanine dehydrogenase